MAKETCYFKLQFLQILAKQFTGPFTDPLQFTEAYSGPCQTCKVKIFGIKVTSFQLLTSFAKSSILDV